MKVDLHTHTKCSDGTDDWKTVLQKAESAGLDLISITDHNNVDVYFLMAGSDEKPNKYFGGKILIGVEPECAYQGRCIELLGYDFDVKKMRPLLKGLYSRHISDAEKQQIKLDIFYKGCIQLGVKFSPNVLETWDRKKHFYPICHLQEDLKKYPENKKLLDAESWDNSIQFYRNFSSKKGTPFYIDESLYYPSAQEICKAIKQSGGKVFIPHIFLYGKDSLPFLEGLVKELDIDGVECFYNSFTPEQTQFLLGFCKKHNLLVSAGSDYHGASRPHVKLGVSDKRLKELTEWTKECKKTFM